MPLVKCFPPEVWDVLDKKLVFKRAPLRAEWIRFQTRYASKVQYLETSYPTWQISLPALHVFQLYSGPLLPNLVSMTWICEGACLAFISPFISPSLTSIAIHVAVPLDASPILPQIINNISTLSPNIRGIEIKGFEHDSSVEEAFSQLLLQCSRHLRKFDAASPISASAFSHISQLPSLEELSLVVKSAPIPPQGLVFPSLRRLEVGWYTRDNTWLKLLSAIEHPVLTTISIACPGSDVEWCMETFELTAGIAMCECLRDLRLESPDEFKITPRIIACNSLFENLTTLRLGYNSECVDFCQTSDLTDDDIDLLTKTMPCLEYLAIGGEPCDVPSQITFKSLYTISHRCIRLKDLQIHFHPASFVTKVGEDSESWDVALGLSDPPSHLCSITKIDVGDIPLPARYDASCIIALGLLRVFPHLKTISWDGDGWKNVRDLIKVGRRFAFGKG